MAYVAPIHRPSSVRHATLCRLLDPDEEHLVIAKTNRLEIYTQIDDGLTLLHTKTVYGTITMLLRLPPFESGLEQLFIGTDLQMYFVVSWNPTSQELQTERTYYDLADRTLKESATQDRCLLDPDRRYLTLDLYKGVISVVPLNHAEKRKGDVQHGVLGEPVPTRIPELEVRSSVFLHDMKKDTRTKAKSRMALLYEQVNQQVNLSVRKVDYSPGVSENSGSADLDSLAWTYENLESGSNHLIAVPAPTYGVLVLSHNSIMYLDDKGDQPVRKALERPTVFRAYEQIDNQRWILSDDYSNLYLLMLILDDRGSVNGWKVDHLGETSEASVLVYLGNGLVFVGSHFGQSQVVRIQRGALEILQKFPNIAPILDFSVMDMSSQSTEVNDFSSGKARLVSGSGGFQDGSFCSIRSGVGLEEQGILGEMSNIAEIYAIRSPDSPAQDDTLIVSFIGETRVFQFSDEGEVDERVEFKGLSMSSSTLLARNMDSEKLLQVTDDSVQIIDMADDMVIHDWLPRSRHNITAASSNGKVLILSVGGTELFVFDLESLSSLEPLTSASFPDMGQISCLHASETPGVQDICFVGFWQNAAVAILEVSTLNLIKSISTTEEAMGVPRSILLLQMISAQSPTLLIAMANGEVVSFDFDPSSNEARSRNATVLGTEQANLKALPRADGLYSCFVTCEHPSLIYGSEGHLVFSAVTAENATRVCSFDSTAYPNAIAIATAEDFRIGLIDPERATHVKTLHVGEIVRRVAYAPSIQAFGLGTIKRIVENHQELNLSSFKLCDEIAFKQLDDYPLDENELVEAVLFCTLRSDDGNNASEDIECFAVGTASVAAEFSDDIRGRILLFSITSERTIDLITEHHVKGACRALAEVDGRLVAGLAKTIVMYSLSASALQKRCSYRTATAPVALSIASTHSEPQTSAFTATIAVADLMKSVSLLTYTRGHDGKEDELTESARHYSTVWSTALTHISNTDDYLLADDQTNLFVLHQNRQGVLPADRRRLEVTSELRLGELVNKMQPIPSTVTSTSAVTPKAFLATRDGGVYLFGVIAPDHRDLLMRLQSKMAEMVHGLGNVGFSRWRALRTLVREAEEPYRFVDGEFVEGYLGLTDGEKEAVVKEMGVDRLTVGAVVGVLEGLRRLR